MNIRRRIIWSAIGAAVILAGIGGVWAAYLRPIKVQVAAIQRDVPVEVFGLGTVEARVTSKVGFKVAGVLIDIRADVGDRVAKGSVLARLDDREQNARLARANAAVQQAAASLQRATAGLGKAEVNFANAKSINDRRQKLVQSSSTSVESADVARFAQDAAQADVSLAASDIAVAHAAAGDSKAQQQQESAALDFHTLTAPYDAMVTARLKELGVALGAGEPVLTLIDPKSVWVLAFIDESKAGEIQVGGRAEIVLRSRPNERLTGKVARIEPESDRVNEERRVAISYDRLPDKFNLGEQAEVYITTVKLPQALLVPEMAISGIGRNHGTVWTVEDGRLQQRDVALGHRLLDGRYEIQGGLPDNAQVVVQLRSGLRVGRSVSVVEEQRR